MNAASSGPEPSVCDTLIQGNLTWNRYIRTGSCRGRPEGEVKKQRSKKQGKKLPIHVSLEEITNKINVRETA